MHLIQKRSTFSENIEKNLYIIKKNRLSNIVYSIQLETFIHVTLKKWTKDYSYHQICLFRLRKEVKEEVKLYLEGQKNCRLE